MTARIVAVVLNWRDAASTRRCVESLRNETGIDAIIVVDNESTGQLRDMQGKDVHLSEQTENLGFSRGINVGLRHGLHEGADAVLVINNDAEVRAGSVDALVKGWELASGRVGMLAPIVLNPDGTEQSTGGFFRAWDASTRDLGARHINYLTWACVLVPRATLEVVGLLDEDFFMYWEDVDYGLRVGDAGLDLVVVRDAVVVHAKSASHGRAGNAIERYSARGLTLLCRKRGGVARFVGLPYRLGGRVLSRIPRGRAAVAAVMAGWRDATRARKGSA